MFPLRPTPRRTATSPDQRTPAVGFDDQREARHRWFKQPLTNQPANDPTMDFADN
ncbi:MAG: hypothetical protein RJA15_1653 [Actinomycetota bacterium]